MSREEIEAKLDIDYIAEWLEKQPFDKEYYYCDPWACPIALMLGNGVTVHPDRITYENWSINLPRELNRIFITRPHNYGAALERAKSERGIKCCMTNKDGMWN